MLRLLIDTSTWLDLSKRRDGQRWIVALRVLVHQGDIELLVPELVIDEFERNRDRIETSMTANVASRFKLIRQDLDEYGGVDNAPAREVIDNLARHVPLIGAMTTRNFEEVLALLQAGRAVEPTEQERQRVIERGLSKRAPFHRSRNSVADALLIEMFGSAVAAGQAGETYAFVTTNSDDFSAVDADKRQPHPDFEEIFATADAAYGLGVDGLNGILLEHFGSQIEELFEESNFVEEPRRLDEIVGAEQEMFDRIWYHRSLQHEIRLSEEADAAELGRLKAVAGPGRRKVEAAYPESGQLGPFSDFELGMLHGKLSTLRWVLGSEWDFLDT